MLLSQLVQSSAACVIILKFHFFPLVPQFDEYKRDLRAVIHGNNTVDGVYITLRMRLRCEVFRNGKAMPGKVFDVLNEVVVDRGSNPYLSKIECYEHDRLITKVRKHVFD